MYIAELHFAVCNFPSSSHESLTSALFRRHIGTCEVALPCVFMLDYQNRESSRRYPAYRFAELNPNASHTTPARELHAFSCTEESCHAPAKRDSIYSWFGKVAGRGSFPTGAF